MAGIRIFSKVLAILFAVILITAPVSTALAAGDSWKDNIQGNKTTDAKYGDDKASNDISQDKSKYAKSSGGESSNDLSKEDKSKDDESHDDEKSRHKLKDRLKSLQSVYTPPLNLKQQAHEDISSIIPVENKNNKDIIKKLDNAELHIAASTDPDAWYGKNRLKYAQESDDGDDDSDSDNDEDDDESEIKTTVFKDERTAAKNILEIISKNKDDTIDDNLLIDILITLVQADRNIAQTSITDLQRAASLTIANPEDNDESEDADNDNDDLQRKLKKALKDFDKANENIEKGEPINAIKHFEKAWEHATTELVNLDAATVPVIIFDSVDNPYINSTEILLLGHVEDAAVYTIPNITLTVNGAASVLDLTNGAFESLLSLHEGDNNISATVTDAFENTGTANITLIVDTVLPVISFDGAQDGLYYNTLVSVSGNMSDEHPDTLTILVNGNPYTSGTPIIAEDAYTVDITARDMAGNTARQSLTFHIDMTPPVITIAEPANGSFVSGAVTVNHTVTDESPVITSMLADGINIIPADSVGTYVVDTTAYADGMHNITVTAKDAAGNTATEGISILVDNTPPEVTILKPLDNESIRGMREILAHVYDLYLKGITISINEEEVSTTSNHTFDTLNYSDGSYNISAEAVDYANNTGTNAISVIVDNTPPVINITSPVNNSFVKGAVSVDANITETNTAAVNVTIDGILLSSSVPTAWDTRIYPDGPHTAGIYVRDTAGNTAAASVSVTVDNTPPAVSLTTPANSSALRGVVDITADIHDTYLADTTISINGTAVSSTSGYIWNTTAYPDGWYSITATAADMVANTGADEIWVEVDNMPPELTVNELTDNPTLKEPEYRINGTVEAGVTLMVNAINVPHNDSFEYVINVTEGTNTITVTATDPAGNTATWTKTRLVDTDSLPDWYETTITGTDPLDGDSDSTKTKINENDNGIKDGQEDFDNDRVINLLEYSFKSNPFSSDSDADGLLDAFELVVTWTNISSPDTDGNGISDAAEDFDNDTLTNLDEQNYGTKPYASDTDKDNLTDYQEIYIFNTNASLKDTDNDGLEDYEEILLNTDPLNPDTDGDGIIDSMESYTVTTEEASVRVKVTSEGTGGSNVTIRNSTVNTLLNTIPGNIGNPVDINTTSGYSNIRIEMPYDPAKLNGSNETDLKIYYYNESSHTITPVPVQGVNTEDNYVWAEPEHFSTYGMYDHNKWNREMWSVDDPTDPILSAGKQTIIKATVHNNEPVMVNNIKVNFYNGNPIAGGVLIGSDTIPAIAANDYDIASIQWTVTSNIENVYVVVDPANNIQETNEVNNIAYKLIDEKMIDSDGDGLSDYDEVHGIRTNYGVYKTESDNPDSDGDGISDGDEIGTDKRWSWSIGGYYFEINSDPNSVDSDDDKLNDSDEYDYGSNPLNPDSDDDKVNDGDEIKIGTDPMNADTDGDGTADGVHYYFDGALVFGEIRSSLNNQGINDEAINSIMSTIEKETQTWPPKEFIVYNTGLGYIPKGFPVLWTVDGGKTVSDSQLEFGLKDGLIRGSGGVNNGPQKYSSNVFFDGVVPISGGTIEMQPYADIDSFRLKGENADTLIIVARERKIKEPVEHEYIVEYIIAGGVIILAAGVIIISLPGAGVAVATGAVVVASAAFIAILASVAYPEEYFKLLEDEGFEIYDNAYGTA